MELIHGYQALQVPLRHPVLTIGNFDGVHLGHAKIIRLAVEKARARGGVSIAMTFRPHPTRILRPGVDLKLLTTYDEKLRWLESLGIDLVLEQPFTSQFAELSAKTFFEEIIRRKVGAEEVVVGYDFGFGRDREGRIDLLRTFAEPVGIAVTEVAQFSLGEDVVSSSRIRQLMLAGEIERANRLLGREFSFSGIVSPGDGRGAKLGFPTANLDLQDVEEKLVPPLGVYVTRAVQEGHILPSVTNIGVRPTFAGSSRLQPRLECHILGSATDGAPIESLYGKLLEVRFLRRLREERRFEGAEALKIQISEDIRQARQFLGLAGN